jgi:hypothetical protein
MSIKEFFQCIVLAAIFSAPFLVEIVKEFV